MKYRPEIDGLRALAVLPVILFHAGFVLFEGGFVGVDIFFVISGYLITTILIEDIENNEFSILKFYERRVRRILPALFFVMLVCIPFAWLWMLPSQMKDFSESLVAVNLFISNILFWREATPFNGYFAPESELKPLLHTWSLAVEEQFYLFFPIFLFFIWRMGKNKIFWIIVTLSLISLVLSEWGWRNKSTANFFLSPTRFWEIFAGSLTAFFVYKRGVYSNNLLSIVGIIAILISIFVYDDTTPFPSIYALVPVLGVVLLIIYGGKDTVISKILSYKILVGIGLISYSAYLWHHPLFAFARINNSIEITNYLMLLLSLSSIALGFISYQVIERPFRRSNALLLSRNKIIILIISASIIIVFGFIGSLYTHKLYNVSKEHILQTEILKESYDSYNREAIFKTLHKNLQDNKTGIMIIGHSAAADFINTLNNSKYYSEALISNWNPTKLCGSGAILEGLQGGRHKLSDCEKNEDIENSFISNLIIADHVIFALDWELHHLEKINLRINEFKKIYGDKFWIIGTKWTDFSALEFERYRLYSIDKNVIVTPDNIYYNLNSKLSSVFLDRFINPYDWMCMDNECKISDNKGDFIQYDGFHLTPKGAKEWANFLDLQGFFHHS